MPVFHSVAAHETQHIYIYLYFSNKYWTFSLNVQWFHWETLIFTAIHQVWAQCITTCFFVVVFFNLMSCPELTASYQWCKRVWQCQLIWVSLPSSLSTDALEQGTSSWCSEAGQWRARGDRLVQLSSVAMNEQNEWEAEHSTYSMCIMYSADIPPFKFL